MSNKNNEEKFTICKTHLKSLVLDRLRENKIKVTSTQVSIIVDELFDVMSEELVKGNSISIRSFGVFSTFETKRFLARHPQDSTEFYYREPMNRVSFKMGKNLKEKINENK